MSADKTPAGGLPRKSGYKILKDVMDALAKRGIPAPDEKLKRIVGGQINALLRGGHDPDRVRHFAIEIALSWDNAKGHQRLLGLRQIVLQDAADGDYAAHEAQKLAEKSPFPLATMADLKRLDPRRPTQRESITEAETTLYGSRPTVAHR